MTSLLEIFFWIFRKIPKHVSLRIIKLKAIKAALVTSLYKPKKNKVFDIEK